MPASRRRSSGGWTILPRWASLRQRSAEAARRREAIAIKIELWSYNYAPEPTGIAPVSTVLAQALQRRGHEVRVIAAHPHYPAPRWGARRLPYSETRDGVQVLRLPLAIGRASAGRRLLQEASFALAELLCLPAIGRCDAVIAVSPCFPALGVAILNRRLRGVPWVLWLQDILPDGAAATGIVRQGRLLDAARRLERAAYRSASAIAVIAESFRRNLLAKGVPAEKIELTYNPATRAILGDPRGAPGGGPPRILVMGNIGHSQGLPAVVRAFERSPELAARDARLVICGTGVEADAVRAAISGERVELRGLVGDAELAGELAAASLGLVTQRAGLAEFNVPSKLMNYFAAGLPVAAVVAAESETASLIRAADAGWIAAGAEQLGRTLDAALADPGELARRGENGRRFAAARLTPDALAEQFEELLARVAARP